MSITPNTESDKEYIKNNIFFKQKYCYNHSQPIAEYIGFDNATEFNEDEFNENEASMMDYIMDELRNRTDSKTFYQKCNFDCYLDNMFVHDILYFDKKENKYDIHVVLLWKKEKNLFVIIDPNTNNNLIRFHKLMKKKYHQYGDFQIINLSKNVLYSSDIEKKHCEYKDKRIFSRDCHDLSIKNSYILKKLHKDECKFEELETFFKIKTTNFKREFPNEFKDRYGCLNNTIFREQHSSNSEIRDFFWNYIDDNYKIINRIFGNDLEMLIGKPFFYLEDIINDVVNFEHHLSDKYNINAHLVLKK